MPRLGWTENGLETVVKPWKAGGSWVVTIPSVWVGLLPLGIDGRPYCIRRYVAGTFVFVNETIQETIQESTDDLAQGPLDSDGVNGALGNAALRAQSSKSAASS